MKNQDFKRETKPKGYKRHLVPCPNCGKDVLEHMTQCPFCKEPLTPKFYQPMEPEKAKKIKFVLAIIGCIIALILLFFVK